MVGMGDAPGVEDPTANVLDLVRAAIQRQDDLRNATEQHVREIASLRADYDVQLRQAETELRRAEAARIDAIRAVDVGAVNRAAEVALTQASTLAAQVAQSAETLRTQVAAAATAATVNLTAALEPIQKDIADLRRAQYEAQGVKSNVGESRLNVSAIVAVLAVLVSLALLIITINRK